MIVIGVISTVIGLLIGSFLSVVITRYGSGETIVKGRSQCPSCEKVIAWYDNIPLLSYLLLRGKCRACKQKISRFYPAVEAVTAGVFAVVAGILLHDAGGVYTAQAVIETIGVWGIAAGLIAIFFYDLRTMQIPMTIVWVVLGTIGILIAMRLALWQTLTFADMWAVLAGGIAGFLPLYLLSALSRERWMGAGDAYIGLIGGLIVGYPAVFFFLTAAFGIGALVGIGLIATGLRSRKDAVPFAPFLIIAIAVTMLLSMLFPAIALHIPYF